MVYGGPVQASQVVVEPALHRNGHRFAPGRIAKRINYGLRLMPVHSDHQKVRLRRCGVDAYRFGTGRALLERGKDRIEFVLKKR